MITYYIKNEDEIITFDTDKNKIEETLKFLPQYADCEILETEEEIIVLDEKFFFKKDVQDIIDERERQSKRIKIEEELKFLDEKRIRAVCEPSMKDENTTWLEYYNQEVYKLREKLKNI